MTIMPQPFGVRAHRTRTLAYDAHCQMGNERNTAVDHQIPSMFLVGRFTIRCQIAFLVAGWSPAQSPRSTEFVASIQRLSNAVAAAGYQ